MFEVARDWNYAAAIIFSESAFILRARESSCIESAFFVAVALTRHQGRAQTRITTSELRDAQRAEHTCTVSAQHKQKVAMGVRMSANEVSHRVRRSALLSAAISSCLTMGAHAAQPSSPAASTTTEPL